MDLTKASQKKLLFGSLIALPLVLLIALLIRYSVNVPFWDQWELVSLFEKSARGTLGFADFFAQHNEHRILFPRLIMYVLAKASHWNTNLEVACNVVLAGAGFYFILKLIKKSLSGSKYIVPASILASLIFFSPLQWENWLWGWQIQWFLNTLSVIAAVWIWSSWHTSPIKKFTLAAIMGIIATYSLASGMFVWLICLPILWFDKKLRRYILPWLFVGGIAVVVHYIGYINPAGHPSKTLFLKEPLQFVEYFVVYMTRPIVFKYILGIVTAVLFLPGSVLLTIWLYTKEKTAVVVSLLPWICLALYSIATGLTTDASRLGFGVEQAYTSRYVTISNLFLLFVCMLLFKTLELSKPKKQRSKLGLVSALSLMAITLLVGFNYTQGVLQMNRQSAHLTRARHCALTATSEQDPCLLLLYPNQPVVWERLEFLRSSHWSGL